MITLNADLLVQAREYARKKGFEAKIAALEAYRKRVLAMYKDLLLITPQYSGDMVSNWDIQLEDSPERAYREWAEKEEFRLAHEQRSLVEAIEPHHAGEQDEAFMSAYMRGVQRMRYVTYYGQPVYFVNTAPLEINSPLIAGPDGIQKLREDGVISAWDSITSYLLERYGARP